jgi:hypothetical protein
LYQTKDHCAAIEFDRRVAVINIILYIVAFSQVTITGSLIVVATFRSSYTKRKRRKHSDEDKKKTSPRTETCRTHSRKEPSSNLGKQNSKHSDGRKKK